MVMLNLHSVTVTLSNGYVQPTLSNGNLQATLSNTMLNQHSGSGNALPRQGRVWPVRQSMQWRQRVICAQGPTLQTNDVYSSAPLSEHQRIAGIAVENKVIHMKSMSLYIQYSCFSAELGLIISHLSYHIASTGTHIYILTAPRCTHLRSPDTDVSDCEGGG